MNRFGTLSKNYYEFILLPINKEQYLLFQKELDSIKQEIAKDKACFLTDEFYRENFKLFDDGGNGTVHLMEELIRCYGLFSLFKDEEIIEGFKRFGLNQNHLRWMIDIDEFIGEINKINQSGFILLPHKIAFTQIYTLYLPAKIRATLTAAFGFAKSNTSETNSDPQLYTTTVSFNYL